MKRDLYQFGFVIEQVLGHITHGQNLQANVAQDPSIQAYWALPIWDAPGLAGKVPNWTLRVGLQVRQALAQMQRQTQLDALFFHTQVTAVLAQKWLKHIPSVISLDATALQYDSLGEFYDHNRGPSWMERWKYNLDRNCFQAAKHIVTWSKWTKQGLVDDYGVPADKITVIPPGVNVQEWNRPQMRRRQDNSPVKILFVGGNLERKGGVVLLEAFQSLRQALSSADNGTAVDLQLHLVTKSNVSPGPGIFVYHDMEPNSAPLKQLYHESDIFCLPTYGDCLPMVLSEAAAAGLPAVSTQVAAIPEITQDGKTGFLVPTGDVLALENALQNLILNPDMRLQQGEQAAAFVKTKFDAQNNASRLLDLLKQTADEARASKIAL